MVVACATDTGDFFCVGLFEINTSCNIEYISEPAPVLF